MWIISTETGLTTGRRMFAFFVRTATRRLRLSRVDLKTRRGRSPIGRGASLRSLTVWVRVPPAPHCDVSRHRNDPEPTAGFGVFSSRDAIQGCAARVRARSGGGGPAPWPLTGRTPPAGPAVCGPGCRARRDRLRVAAAPRRSARSRPSRRSADRLRRAPRRRWPFVTAGPAVAGPGAVFAHAGTRATAVTSEGQPPAHGRDDAAARAETFESLVASLGWRWALRCRGRVASAPRRKAGVLAGCIANKGP